MILSIRLVRRLLSSNSIGMVQSKPQESLFVTETSALRFASDYALIPHLVSHLITSIDESTP